MSSRNYISEIHEIRNRLAYNYAHAEVFSRLSTLEQAFKDVPKDNAELLRYFPIGLVSALEGCFRVLIAELIDSGDHYLSNCENLLKNQKINFDLIIAFKNKNVSIGEFVSHVISINKLEDIDSAITAITGKNFLKELKYHHSRWDFEVLKKEKCPIIENSNENYKSISRAFELRHIFCHEIATGVKCNDEEIELCFNSVSLFLKAATDYIMECIHPNAPLTQTDMNIESHEELKEIISKMESVKLEIQGNISEDPARVKLLDSAYKKWIDFYEEYSSYVADEYKGGSIRPLIYSNTASRLCNEFLKNLKSELESIENR